MGNYLQKYENYKKALKKLEALRNEKTIQSDVLRDALIQRYEFTFELVWKLLKAYLEDQGIQNINSPKSVFKAAFCEELIFEEDIWLQMLKDRNLTSRIYDEKTAIKISERIVNQYVDAFNKLLAKIEGII